MTEQEAIREGLEKIVKLCANKPLVYTPEMCVMDLMEYLDSQGVVLIEVGYTERCKDDE